MNPRIPTPLHPPTAPPGATAPAPALDYAPPRRFSRLRRWIGPGSAGFVVLLLIAAGAGTWGGRGSSA